MHTAHGDTQKQVAEILGIAEQTLSAKVNGETDFKHSEIKTLIDRYGLTPEQVDTIFFDKWMLLKRGWTETEAIMGKRVI